MKDTILLIEDEALLADELARHFRRGGWHVVLAGDLAAARVELIEHGLDPLVVLSDMNLPDGNALDLLREVRDRASAAEWLFLTGYGSVTDSVRALKLGACDFLEKPCDIERLDLVVATAARSARAQRRLRDHAEHERGRYSIEAFAGGSPAAAAVRRVIARLAEVPISALIVGGETGTGKGLATRILHHNGPRARGPLVELNCAALPRELLESELFGHEAGAFTGARSRRRGVFEQASGGTLLLDEIAEIPTDLQSKLLKVIEDQVVRPLGGEREVDLDVQIVAASNRDLQREVSEGSFRADLYHRLSVFKLDLPSLRERKQDLDDLVPLFVAEYAARAGKSVRVVPEEMWRALRAYDWPGNVRELRNVLERCVLLSDSDVLSGRWLQLPQAARGASGGPGSALDGVHISLDGSLTLDDMEREIVRAALERAGHNVTAGCFRPPVAENRRFRPGCAAPSSRRPRRKRARPPSGRARAFR
jgi:DNA-binding NtrC family response regulator